jgi:hypothetical protein
MRAKVVLSASVLALAVLVPAIYFHFKTDAPQAAVEPVASDDSTNVASPGLPPILKRASSGATDQGRGAAVQENTSTDEAPLSHEDYLVKRKADLYELGMSQNPASLKVILSEMHNPDPEIRKSALSATIDFGSQEATPALQNEMAWAEDPEEKLAIKKAIEFLQLPAFDSAPGITQK